MNIILPMIFVVVEMLSMLFGHTFTTVHFLGIDFHFIVGVIYFCLGFYILDLIAELYENDLSNKVIFGKIICQIIFVLLIQLSIYLNQDPNQTEFLNSMTYMPKMIFASIIASIIGYKLTTHIMQSLKIRYEGKFITIRYLVSTLPGEFVFSLVYSFIFLYNEYSFSEYIKIFYSLAIAKFAFSLAFSTIFKPATKIISFIIKNHSNKGNIYSHIT